MKRFILFLIIVILLNSCSKNDQDSIPDYMLKNYHGLILQSYDTCYYTEIPFGNSYMACIPQDSVVSGPIDLDDDGISDFVIRVGHYLYSPSPHSANTFVNISIEGSDEDNQIAVEIKSSLSGIAKYKPGDVVNGDSTFKKDAYIMTMSLYGSGVSNSGDLIIGLRKKLQGQYRYGYLMFNAGWAKIVLDRSVFNKNQDQCVVDTNL